MSSEFGFQNFEDVHWLLNSNLDNFGFIAQQLNEAALLWKAVKMTGGPILEIGRARAGSTVLILAASEDRPVVSVDLKSSHAAETQEVLDRPDVARRAEILIQDSRHPLPNHEFGLIFIDGDHTYEGVRADVCTHWQALRSFDDKPALAIFHDAVSHEHSHVEPVKKLCDELLREDCTKFVTSGGSMLLMEKLSELPDALTAMPLAETEEKKRDEMMETEVREATMELLASYKNLNSSRNRYERIIGICETNGFTPLTAHTRAYLDEQLAKSLIPIDLTDDLNKVMESLN